LEPGVRVVEELPPPQEVSPGEKSAETIANSRIKPLVVRNDEKSFRSFASNEVSPVQIDWLAASFLRPVTVTLPAADVVEVAIPAMAETITTDLVKTCSNLRFRRAVAPQGCLTRFYKEQEGKHNQILKFF
jgi:hypothetical protein